MGGRASLRNWWLLVDDRGVVHLLGYSALVLLFLDEFDDLRNVAFAERTCFVDHEPFLNAFGVIVMFAGEVFH